jgi:hypothetical protein
VTSHHLHSAAAHLQHGGILQGLAGAAITLVVLIVVITIFKAIFGGLGRGSR